jgi:hypothetical protein
VVRPAASVLRRAAAAFRPATADVRSTASTVHGAPSAERLRGRRPGRPAIAAVLGLCAGAVLAPPAGAVVGGRAVAEEAHAAVVRLADACTATLVAPRRLLSAGHCASRVRPGETRVRIGGQDYRAARVARHPAYRFLTPDYPAEPYRDVSLVELDRDVVGVAPVPLSRRRVGPGTVAVLLGFGTPRAGEPGDYGVLRRAKLVVRGAGTCRRGLDRARQGQGGQYRDRVMLCTQDPDGVRPWRSGCYGDSGGPLLLGRPGRGPLLVGVDSWGVACGARGGDPEVFARASAEWAFVHAADPGWRTTPYEEPFAPGVL